MAHRANEIGIRMALGATPTWRLRARCRSYRAAAIVAVGLVAAYLPARRAASVDPMEALRYE